MTGRWRWLPFAIVFGIYLLELGIDVIEVDSAQYAHIAEEMLRTKSFLLVHNRGADYLDKPPLTFWLAAGSFSLFGVSTWAYKLPSLLAALLAIFSTYRLARLLQPERVAYLAALMLASCLATFMWTNDVRTDTVLLGAVCFATWQLAAHLVTARASAFWLGWAGVAAALMAKGPIGAFVPLVAVGAQAVWLRNWRWLFNPRWLAGLVLCLALLAPMLFGLHQQFGWRGVTFFFWTQSFGRITGESSWSDTTTPLFFTHTVLWELLPWTPFFLFGLAKDLGRLVSKRATEEVLSLAGFLVPFVALSMSHYKLPHYIFVTLPFACIIAGRQLDRVAAGAGFRVAFAAQLVVVASVWLLCVWIGITVFPMGSKPILVALIGAAGLSLHFGLYARDHLSRLVLPSFVAIASLAFLLATHFYPALLTYQAPSMAAHMLTSKHVPSNRVWTMGSTSYALDFLLRTSVPRVEDATDVAELLKTGDVWIFTDKRGHDELSRISAATVVAELQDYPVSRWSLAFFDPETRARQIQRRYLVQVRGHPAPSDPAQ